MVPVVVTVGNTAVWPWEGYSGAPPGPIPRGTTMGRTTPHHWSTLASPGPLQPRAMSARLLSETMARSYCTFTRIPRLSGTRTKSTKCIYPAEREGNIPEINGYFLELWIFPGIMDISRNYGYFPESWRNRQGLIMVSAWIKHGFRVDKTWFPRGFRREGFITGNYVF